MIAGKPAPPDDERSRNADLIERMQVDSDQTLDRVERLVPGRLDGYRRYRLGRR